MQATVIRLTIYELEELTGYAQPAKQLKALHERGFWRAVMDHDGRVILTRAHYEAVEAGAVPAGKGYTPQLKPA